MLFEPSAASQSHRWQERCDLPHSFAERSHWGACLDEDDWQSYSWQFKKKSFFPILISLDLQHCIKCIWVVWIHQSFMIISKLFAYIYISIWNNLRYILLRCTVPGWYDPLLLLLILNSGYKNSKYTREDDVLAAAFWSHDDSQKNKRRMIQRAKI